ncbi:MAG: hypothetical protein AB8B93_05920 [Pseudomonadales bacterium]
MMSITISDLATAADLDQQALLAVTGGNSGIGQGAATGPVSGLIGVGAGGGISLFSPVIAIQTIVNTPVTVQLATVLEQIQNIDTSNIVNSVLAG